MPFKLRIHSFIYVQVAVVAVTLLSIFQRNGAVQLYGNQEKIYGSKNEVVAETAEAFQNLHKEFRKKDIKK